MFKKILALFLFACLLLSAAGCGNEQQPAEESESSRETADVTNGDDSRDTIEETPSSPSEQEDAFSAPEDEPDSAPVQETTEPVRPEPQTSAPTIPADSQAESTPAPPSAPSTKDTEAEQPAESPSIPDTQAPPVKAEPETKPEETAQPEPTPQPEFNVEYWVSFAQSYAESIGLELDGSAIWCWDTPIVAGSHCLYLERAITDRLTRYKEGGDISKVWIWSEPRGDGSYDLYIGYA